VRWELVVACPACQVVGYPLSEVETPFADRGDTEAVVIRPGYLDSHWTKASWTNQGLRDKVGATHRPLPDLMHAFLDAGLTLERFAEGGRPTPVVLAVRARTYG
jgi:hypothetical protein